MNDPVKIQGWEPDTCGCYFATNEGELVGVLRCCALHETVRRELGEKALLVYVMNINRHKNAVIEQVRKVYKAETKEQREMFYAAKLWRMNGDALELDISPEKAEKAEEVTTVLKGAKLPARVVVKSDG